MPYVNDTSNPLDWIMAPLKAISAPWGAVQTGIAGGDPWEALADPDKAIRGRQFLEKMGWISPSTGVGGDIAGTAVDLADPLGWLAMGGLGKGLQALRGVGKAAEAAGTVAKAAEPAAAGLGRFIPGWGTTAAIASPLAGSAILGANQRSEHPSAALNTLGMGLMVAPLVHGGYNLAKGLLPHAAGMLRGATEGLPGALVENPLTGSMARGLNPGVMQNDIKAAPVELSPHQANALVPYRGPSPAISVATEYGNSVRDLMARTSAAEKPGNFNELSPEMQKLMHSDWKAFSRARGYTEPEIANFQRWLDIAPPEHPLTYASDEEMHRAFLRDRGGTPPLQQMFGPGMMPPTGTIPLPAPQYAPPFYSRLGRAAEALPEGTVATGRAERVQPGRPGRPEKTITLPSGETKVIPAQPDVPAKKIPGTTAYEQMIGMMEHGAPEGFSQQEVEAVLEKALTGQSEITAEMVKQAIAMNGLQVERKVLGGGAVEGQLARAAREKYQAAELAVEAAQQQRASMRGSTSFKEIVGSRYSHPLQQVHPLQQAVDDAISARDAANAEYQATAGKPDELVLAERSHQSAHQSLEAARAALNESYTQKWLSEHATEHQWDQSKVDRIHAALEDAVEAAKDKRTEAQNMRNAVALKHTANAAPYKNLTPPHTGPLSRDMEILTEDGWRRIDGLAVGQMVLTRCDDGGMLEYAPIEALPRVFAPKLYHFGSRTVDMLVTPEHQMVFARRKDGNAFKIQRATAEKLWKMSDCAIPLTGEWTGTHSDTFFGLPARDVAEFIGWYIAEGSATRTAKGTKSTLQIAQCKKHNPENCARLEALFNRLGFAWRYYLCKRGGAYGIGVRSMPRPLVDCLHAQGLSDAKAIPRFLMTASKPILESLLDALLHGDGCHYKPERNRRSFWCYFTKSKVLADDVQVVVALLGKRATIKRRPTGIYVVRICSTKWASIDKGRQKKGLVEYNDYAFCVTVRNHAIYVRRNGVPAFTGNSNYREVLLKVPIPEAATARVRRVREAMDAYLHGDDETRAAMQSRITPKQFEAWARTRPNMGLSEEQITHGIDLGADDREHLLNMAMKGMLQDEHHASQTAVQAMKYSHPHYSSESEGSIIAEPRISDGVNDRGLKELNVHEVQSDLHQAGREVGYHGGDLPKGWKTTRIGDLPKATINSIRETLSDSPHDGGYGLNQLPNDLLDRHVLVDDSGAVQISGTSRDIDKVFAHDPKDVLKHWDAQQNRMPNLPYKNNEWARLALRHIIDMAHKEGHDSIAIDGGDLVSRWATGGGGSSIQRKAMKKFYDEVLVQMMKQEGFKHEPFQQTITNPNNPAQSEFLRHRFRLTDEKAAQIAHKGQPLLSMLPWFAGAGMGAAATGAARMPWDRQEQ